MTALLLLLFLQTADIQKATLRGHVYDAGEGTPLRRVTVSLYFSGGRPGAARGVRNEPRYTLSDTQGAFEFRDVEPGRYTLVATKSGYLSGGYGQQRLEGPGKMLNIAPGEEIKDLDIRLTRGGVITGVVTDEDGEPILGAQVQVLVRQYRPGGATVVQRNGDQSDDLGRYRIHSLSPGRYYVRAFHYFGTPDQRWAFAPSFYPSAASVQDAQRIEIGPANNEVTQVNFTLRMVPTVSVSGLVMDTRLGRPAANGNVNFFSTDQVLGRTAGGRIQQDGSFHATGLLPGRYRATVMVQEPTESRGERSFTRTLSHVIDIGTQDITSLVLNFGPGVTVRGKVITDGAPPPNPSAGQVTSVQLVPKGEAFPGAAGGSARVTPEQTFELQGVQPGEYEFRVMGGGSAYLREVRIGGRDISDSGLRVEDAAPGLIELVMDAHVGQVEGVARDEEGQPLGSGFVTLVAADPAKRANSGRFRATSISSQEGAFRMSNVIPGDYLMLPWPGPDAAALLDPDILTRVEKHAVRIRVERDGKTTQDVKLATEVKAVAQAVAQ
jgi:protocatechuate 3,4-dioxygenase beta subunit